jgi:hypothetical protein
MKGSTIIYVSIDTFTYLGYYYRRTLSACGNTALIDWYWWRAMTLEEFRGYLKEKAHEYGSQKTLARHLGVNEAYLSDVIRGRRDPSHKLLWACGFQRVITYKPIRKE